MGFFNSLRNAAAESAGRVMMQFYKKACEEMAVMEVSTRRRIILSYSIKRKEMLGQISNMTQDGIRKAGQDFQRAGNKLKRASVSEGLPLLLVGIWLESAVSVGSDAADVHQMLEDLACQID